MMLRLVLPLACALLAVNALPVQKRDTAVLMHQQIDNLRDNCFPRGGGGCTCTIKKAGEPDKTEAFDNLDECKKPTQAEVARNKATVQQEFKQKYGNLKENCFPKPKSGCRCNVKDENGAEVVRNFEKEEDCRDVMDESAKEAKAAVNEEIKQKFGQFKENCFPKPSGGCKCNEKDANGNEMVATYGSDAECKVSVSGRVKRGSQNVRDPVREQAQRNYAAVVNELNEKFKGLKENCFPRPKGCMCIIGKDKDGREINERRMKDKDCKCQPGERGNGCPVGGA
ncbi:hypothetical protein QR680_002598 [Steinernema hermaphroditum]|uniref:Thyroglobulin type-1 domain-containing protein n=1 Tax=Steinernema hermaphroditum TaxID=289476 RepID=A0AA39LIH1_9BILA|nr:hypothetical protein QR680_002598 [Steinernema hermaphroditum]